MGLIIKNSIGGGIDVFFGIDIHINIIIIMIMIIDIQKNVPE